MSEVEMKKSFSINVDIAQYNAMVGLEAKKIEKSSSFKERLVEFKKVKTLEEAKTLAAKILPTANEVNRFYVGDLKCTVINKKDLFRICVDSEEEFLSYDFQ